jgi:hypothetical protein
VFENGVYKEIRRGIPCGYPRRRLRLFQKRRISLVRLQGVRALIFDLFCDQEEIYTKPMVESTDRNLTKSPIWRFGGDGTTEDCEVFF